jgi:hypothetical protein
MRTEKLYPHHAFCEDDHVPAPTPVSVLRLRDNHHASPPHVITLLGIWGFPVRNHNQESQRLRKDTAQIAIRGNVRQNAVEKAGYCQRQ